MGQITVFSGPERRRRWSEAERLKILTAAFQPGACVAHVARQHDVSTALIYTWRRKQVEQDRVIAFAEAVVEDVAVAEPARERAVIIVDLAPGRRVQILSGASPAVTAAALKALR